MRTRRTIGDRQTPRCHVSGLEKVAGKGRRRRRHDGRALNDGAGHSVCVGVVGRGDRSSVDSLAFMRHTHRKHNGRRTPVQSSTPPPMPPPVKRKKRQTSHRKLSEIRMKSNRHSGRNNASMHDLCRSSCL